MALQVYDLENRWVFFFLIVGGAIYPFLLELMYFVKYCYFTKALNGNHTWNENINVRMINALITKPIKLKYI